MIASNIITAQSISSNAIITGSIQSKNFDGSYDSVTGLIDAGNNGFYLEGHTGTIIANTLVARDDIITGDMIKFSDGKALQSNSETGELEVVVDNDTLSIQDGKLAIKSIPSTAVVLATGDIVYSGGVIEKNLGTYYRGLSEPVYSSMIRSGDSLTTFAKHDPTETTRGPSSLFVIDLLDHFDSVDNINSITLYNLTISVDYTNMSNLAGLDGLCFLSVIVTPSDSLTSFTNVSQRRTNRFFQITNPVFPLAEVDYTLNSVSLKPTFVSSNRYLHVYMNFWYSTGPEYVQLDPTDHIKVKLKSTSDSRLVMNGTGTLRNSIRSTQDLFNTTADDNYWEYNGEGTGFDYNDTVFN